MRVINLEIKARCRNQNRIREILEKRGAIYVGIDKQTDTYFNVRGGRLKLREGSTENVLVYYLREEVSGPKRSDVILYQSANPEALKRILTESLGIRVKVEKEREIYLIDNVKFHLDNVKNLGRFVEIEAQDRDGSRTPNELKKQVYDFMRIIGIKKEELVKGSYSDMLT